MPEQIRPKDLPPGSPVSSAAVMYDDGVTVSKSTPLALVNAAVPLASQTAAETGDDNTTRVSPLRVKQAIDALGVSREAAIAPTGTSLIGFDQLSDQAPGTVGYYLANDALNAGAVLQVGSTNDIMNANRDVLQALLAAADTRGKAVRIPQNDTGWYISPGITAPLVPLIIEGTVYTNTTGPLITMTATGPANSVSKRFFVGGGGKVYNLNGTQNQRSSCVIQFTSTDVYILYPTFENLDTYGFYYPFINDCPTFASPFGRENRMNHIQSSGIIPHYYGSLNCKGAFLLKRGSGTGAQFLNCTDDMAVGSGPEYRDPIGNQTRGYPAYVRVETGGEANVVCGDFTIAGDFAGPEAGMLSYDASCIYLSKIRLEGQVDAQARRTVFEDPPGNNALRNCAVNVLTGGDIDLLKDAPYFAGSNLDSVGASSWETGFGVQDLTAGAKSYPLVYVQPRIRSTTYAHIIVSGDCTGVNAGALNITYALRHNGAGVVVTQVQNLTDPASSPAGFFAITPTVDAVTGVVTFTLNFTPTASGSAFECNVWVNGGVAKVKRGGSL